VSAEALADWRWRHLSALSDHRYLDHKAGELRELEAFGASWPGPYEHVEIGSNRGDFAFALARANAGSRVLALEWRVKWVIQCEEERRAGGPENLRFLHADARVALPLLVAPASIERLYVFYPDPWWKKRHLHRRLIDVPFLDFCAEALAPGGALVLKTDARVVRDSVVEQLPEALGLAEVPALRWPDERAWAWTNRERQCMQRGIATYRVILERADAPARNPLAR
jgi:tRNA (guanine-N7-)-methyltransferase